jgi:hypothetical protein
MINADRKESVPSRERRHPAGPLRVERDAAAADIASVAASGLPSPRIATGPATAV